MAVVMEQIKNKSGMSGNKRQVYIGVLEEIDTTSFPALPTAPANLAQAGTISDPVVFISGGQFYPFENIHQKPKLMTEMVGESDSKAFENTGTMVTSGNTPQQIGFLNQHKNADLIVIYEDLDGQARLLGTPDLPAKIEVVSMDSGDAISSAKQLTIEIKAAGHAAPVYTGPIALTPAV
jgi:hypothetical protein